ncbi:imidazolonepropionase [Austwickia chelonae]|uniref:Imidazolonepropionase n=1 Tax=Austwickia chelonae NBRC 105200 TaxID=1184607 RepID=K6UMA9_9MICO|nr:imidazolonepropionase [Austwickia chelonae]GAB77951.1 imidazolonepropionase [Austwickia chelonae NBRC 105200]SEV92916.1 imidazolonepropionase [Austwickia chelonae]
MSTSSGAEVVTGIGELWTVDDRCPEDPRLGYGCGVLVDAAVVVEEGLIVWVGPAAQAPAADRRTDVAGRAVLPGWVDSHSHLVFAGDRSAEFAARMAGRSYTAGGIGVTTAATREAADEQLRELIAGRVREAVRGGTTYLETKTGYGLSVEQESRSARLAREAVDEVTFLGAHLVPGEFASGGPSGDRADYVDLVCGPMLDAVRDVVSWADVFCEEGAFDVEESRRILSACREAGLGLRVHGNQLGPSGGVALAVELGAASVDHCNFLSASDLDALARSGTVATVLPACDLSTRAPLAPARALLDAGAVVALASNCNPGTSYTTSMNFCVATAVLQMKLTVAEAVRAATWGGARALRRDVDLSESDDGCTPGAGAGLSAGNRPPVGSIRVGARADLHVLSAPSATHLAYRPGMPLTWAVWREGLRIF